MANKLNLMARFQDQPALIEEGRSAWLEACLQTVAAKADEFEKMDASDEDFWFAPDDYRSYFRPYKVTDGVLQVPVKGVLMGGFPYAYGSWATGYEYIWQAVKRGAEDSNVKGIALVIDSGGGMVSGNFDLVDKVFALRGTKPIRAYAAEHAYSAAYSIASVADSITVARTGGVGSIGVVVVHMEMSQMLESAGITTTIIRSKPGKMEGNAYEALSEGARERIQERVDEFHNQFVSIVARNRGMTVEAVDATNALTFMPQQALDNGLADEIGSLDDAISAFMATLNSEGDEEMADFTKAQHEEILAKAVADATTAAKAEAVNDGAAAERARITTILGSEAAATRPSAALMMVNLGISAEAAAVELAKLPVEKPVAQEQQAAPTGAGAPKGMLKAAMQAEGGAGIEADDKNDDGNGRQLTRAERASAMVRV